MGSGTRFWFRGEVVLLDQVRSTMSVLEWLRLSGESRGTKEGCNQGDCGACMVSIAELSGDGLRLKTANACLLLMPMLDGKALFTVEDVGRGEDLHPVQQALVDHGGSQCGFCTPGFVMSIWAHAENCLREGCSATREGLTDAVTGNLCRCTGYRPIVDAAVAAGLTTSAQGTEAAGRVTNDWKTIEWENLTRELLELAQSRSPAAGQGTSFIAPESEDALALALIVHPTARIVAGGTDLVVSMRATGEALDENVVLVSTARIASMARIDERDDMLVIGSAVSLEDSWAAVVSRAPALDRLRRRFASPAIRGMGTIGGNLANSSPIADLVPVLIALDAEVELVSAAGQRVVTVADFSTGVRKNVMQPEEFVARVHLPLRAFDCDIRAHKISRRFDDDISSVSAVFALTLADGLIVDARVVFGGLATTVRRARAVESAVIGSTWTETALRAAQAALAHDFAPIDDHRASGWYRQQAAIGLLERWWFETSPDAPAVDHDVWGQR